MSSTVDRYTAADYLEQNPGWHVADSAWKADHVLSALAGQEASSICEVGCGAGEVLRRVGERRSATRCVGYDIAPDALALAEQRTTDRLSFRLADAADCPERFDVMLVLDVIEHVEDPIGFLRRLRHKASMAILHVPLDLSVQSVARPARLLEERASVGHLHYFTAETAVATIESAGYEVVTTTLTAVTLERPVDSRLARMARIPRRALPRRLAARWLGGFSLLVTARPTAGSSLPRPG